MTSIVKRIIKEHLLEGEFKPGKEIGIKIDNTLTQDATGTMAYLQFEALGLDKVKTELSVSFVDHNILQTDHRNADDHRYLASVAAKYGIKFSKPGNGICHQVFLERFARPGKTLLGSDSHTPTAGGMGMIAIGAGGLDVAIAMGGGLFYVKTPKIIGIKLLGSLPEFVSAKDVILEILRKIGVKGGVGNVLEYFGPGVNSLSVPERATITNMGAETGATTSIFPSDQKTREFLRLQKRENQYLEIQQGTEKDYDKIIEVNLSDLEPLVAKPHSPGNVVPVSEIEGFRVDQVAIGSCTNSSLKDMLLVGSLLKEKQIDKNVVLGISPGSRQVLIELAKRGTLLDIISAGARILECACGPCIGMGFAPKTDAVSVRTFNRNFYGRSGTKTAKIYLTSPETAVATALNGRLTDPRKLGAFPLISLPEDIEINDSLIIDPPKNPQNIEIIRGRNIVPLPSFKPLEENLAIKVLIKVEDNITTDDIMPAGAKILPYRSNLPKISNFVFEQIDEKFSERALEAKEQCGGAIIGGSNYGQGSSREHAALAPRFLGIKVIVAKSFARIHRDNLINFGILPLTFLNDADHDKLKQDDLLEIQGIKNSLLNNTGTIEIKNLTQISEFAVEHDLSNREREIIMAGGKLNYTRDLLKSKINRI
ncbi:MAG: aconitate hydratase [Promethearchaeota archaeon]|nr:MAG: aconitate hydratase [Candidatus Lokiarchaeota archaeon]